MRSSLLLTALLTACSPQFGVVEDGEWLPGGDATNTLLLGSNAFLRPAANLTPEHEALFYGGNSFLQSSLFHADDLQQD